VERPDNLQLSHVVARMVMEFSHENQTDPLQIIDHFFERDDFSIGNSQDMGVGRGGVPQMESDDQQYGEADNPNALHSFISLSQNDE
jgi:hypothetical protein